MLPFGARQARDASAAADLVSGLSRLLIAMDYRPLAEVPVGSGRRADIVALGAAGEVIIVEIKSGPRDFLSDAKWQAYLPHCDRFFFGVGPDFDVELLPRDTGIMVADRFGAEIVRPAAIDKMHASTRRALLLRFARTAAGRVAGSCVKPPDF